MPWLDANGLLPGRASPEDERGGLGAPGLGAADRAGASAAGFWAAGASGTSAAGAAVVAAGSGAGAGVFFGAGFWAAGASGTSAAGAGVFAAGFGPGVGAPELLVCAAAFAGGVDVLSAAGNLSRMERTMGGSSVDDAERTYSPADFNSASKTLLSTPSSLASSYTRTFATTLLSRPVPDREDRR